MNVVLSKEQALSEITRVQKELHALSFSEVGFPIEL